MNFTERTTGLCYRCIIPVHKDETLWRLILEEVEYVTVIHESEN